MKLSKSVARRLAIQQAAERKAAGDQHYNHAWRSLDTAEGRLLAIQRSHVTRPVCLDEDKSAFCVFMSDTIINIEHLLILVKKAADIQLEKEGRE